MLKRIILIFAILFFAIKPGVGQKLRFEHLSVSQGLSNGVVTVIVQDSVGFIWIGTQDGLNRYDGNKFEVYTHKPGDSLSIGGNNVNDILCDGHVIWVATTKGIDKYLLKEDIFLHIPVSVSSHQFFVSNVYKDFKNRIIISSSIGLFYYDEKSDTFKTFVIPGATAINNGSLEITSIFQDSDSAFWLGTSNAGLFRFDETKREFSTISHFSGSVNTFLGNKIFSFFEDNQHAVWVGTNVGLYSISKKNYTVKRYLNDDGLPHITVNQIFEDSKNNLLIATNGGLSIFNRKNSSFRNYYHDDFDPTSLNNNSIRCIFEDAQKNLWLGSGEEGINISKTLSVHFESLRRLPNNSNSLNYSYVLSVIEDRNGNLWIGTNGGGVNFYETKTGRFSYPSIPYVNEFGRRAAAIKTILEAHDGTIWIGTYMGGLIVYDPDSKKYTTFSNIGSKNSISSNAINYLFQDSESRIWIATDGGINIYDPVTADFSVLNTRNSKISSDFINYFFEDNNHQIWVGTYFGLNRINPATMEISTFMQTKKPGSISSDISYCILQDSKNQIWIGTDFGLNLYDPQNNTFKLYTTDNGLPNNSISCILEDNRSNLWISTNKGISRYDINKDKFTNYSVKDGLTSTEYYHAACFKGKSGFMYFGGTEGLTYFNPDRIRPLNHNIPLVFTNLYIFNQAISPKDNTVLDSVIFATSELTLNYDQSYIGIEFASLNFVNSSKDVFTYFLEGFDQQWNIASDSRIASYTKLPPGKYTLRVKAINENGSEVERSIAINVRPPFYKSIWAYFLYFFAIFALLYFFYSYLHSKTIYRHNLQLERIEKEKAIELNQAKVRFFVNVSHDFKTPLTLIVSPLEKLISKGKELSEAELTNLYHIIYRNTLKLSRLINQIMDLRRIDTGNVKLNVTENDVITFLKELSLNFQEHARQHKIDFKIEHEQDFLKVWYDTDKVEKVFFNIISNAFRYSADGKQIIVKVEKVDDVTNPKDSSNISSYAKISFIDQGRGIPEDQLDKVFSRFYQVQTESLANPASSGIGLSIAQEFVEMHQGFIQLISKPGKGSTFSVFLPLGKEHFHPEDFLTEVIVEPALQIESSVEAEQEQIITERKKYKLLIVEDNFELRNFLIDSLKNKYNVLEASNGRDGLNLASENLPDIVISDVMMPVMTGIELCKALKSDLKTSHIPVILLTVLNNVSNQIEGFEIGADDYVTKPFNLNLLEARIFNLIETRKRLSRRFMEDMKTDTSVKSHNYADEKFMQKALEVVEHNISNAEFSAEDFALQIGISRSNLHVKLKALTDQSATEFIRIIRLKKSIELLSTHRYNISEVSYMIGFNSISYFNRCFKQQFGITPSEFLSDGLKNN